MFTLGQISSQKRPRMLVDGGDIITVAPDGYKYHVIKNSTTINVYIGGEMEILLVGGGGGGGHSYWGGGGGAGGVVRVPNHEVTAGSYSAIIGNGGAGSPARGSGPPYGSQGNLLSASSGQDTTFLGFTALGGGRGAVGTTYLAASGGSGGGAGENGAAGAAPTQVNGFVGSTAFIGYGGSGGAGTGVPGGGGGASGQFPGGSPAYGGDGYLYPAFSSFRVGGGGNASSLQLGTTGTTIWGGGLGSRNATGWRQEGRVDGSDGAANTGGGGGGGGGPGATFAYYFYYGRGGTGGSGLIILKYRYESEN